MHTTLFSLFMVTAVLALAGCNPQARGFKLPDGDIAGGKAAFTELACNDCHRIADIDINASANSGFDLILGGKTTSIKTYGQLLTSVINPSHKIARRYSTKPLDSDGQSAMRSYNDVMTVQQLVDLVTFLEANYELELPQTYTYM